ncbi:MAG TPA: NADH-quinone oxidoreductase subunit N [Candidatus Limnocylindria bacterium]|nr:NADH-quinone oxidoreductase subunit N [Candidatus Limnocylindria bacterium]
MSASVANVLGGWPAMLPSLVVVGVALLAMTVDLVWRDPDADGAAATGVVGLGAAIVVILSLWGSQPVHGLAGTLVLDRFALFVALLVCVAAVLSICLSIEYVREQLIAAGDYYVLVLLATSGMILMGAAGDLVVVFLALEVMSVAVYVLAGMLRGDVRSNEAALKYFLLGAFASGFLLYGIALVYGATGSTRLDALAEAVAKGPAPMLLGGVALLLVGFGFKVALVPFHAWTPDVYEGAPTSVTAFMAVGVKAAGFAALVRVAAAAFEPVTFWQPLLWTLAVATMTVGNACALVQTSVKRMLAYSSIAHAGYALIGLVAGTAEGVGALLFYLVVYTFMNVGAFGVLLALGRSGERNEDLGDLAGVGLRHPVLGVVMTVCMLSLAGMPLTAGFTGKFYLFSAALDAGCVWLAVIAVLNSLVSVAYYLGVLIPMYMREGTRELVPPRARPWLLGTIVLAAVMTLVLGIDPAGTMRLAASAAASLR